LEANGHSKCLEANFIWQFLVDHQKMEVKEVIEGAWKKMEEWCTDNTIIWKPMSIDWVSVQMLERQSEIFNHYKIMG
jgi:hypothetical protein